MFLPSISLGLLALSLPGCTVTTAGAKLGKKRTLSPSSNTNPCMSNSLNRLTNTRDLSQRLRILYRLPFALDRLRFRAARQTHLLHGSLQIVDSPARLLHLAGQPGHAI